MRLKINYQILSIAVGILFGSIANCDEIDFSRDVQPIFAKRCLACHGPDKAESGLRLTEQDAVFGEADSGERAIVPNNPDESELLKRITSEDEDVRMPPEGKPLTDAQIATIRKWVEQGAAWKKHWGFVEPTSHTPPSVANQNWVRNEIDAFIAKKLEQQGLEPAPEADPGQLMRRAYYDLTGLPPTPEQVSAYLSDKTADRYEKLVDSLLESDHFGERWGRHWLDLVRFAETNSYERDGPKPEAWRYRDYVIRSFNDDKPYDRFIIEQLAGDEIENPTHETIAATGYYRLGLWDDEPADPELAIYDGLDDIVSTTGQVFLGLTINCARCHDHKIDPIPQNDYYGMLAFFHNIKPYSKNQDNILRAVFKDDLAKADYERRVNELEEHRNESQNAITEIEHEFSSKYDPKAIKSFVDIDDLKYEFYRSTWEELPNFDDLKAETEGVVESGKFDASLATRDHSFGFVFKGQLKVPADGEYEFELDSDDGSRLLIDGKEIIRYDGIHETGSVQKAKVQLAAGGTPIRLDYFQADAGRGLMVAWSGPEVPRRLLTPNSLDVRGIAKLIDEEGRQVLGEERFDRYKELKKKLQFLKRSRVDQDQVLSVKEYGRDAPETFVLTRGSPHAPAGKVEPRFPEIFGDQPPSFSDLPDGIPSTGRRLALAKWIASPQNMQTSRVMVNRIWQHLFDRGIVSSASNFGILGTAPTHPELLDWLGLRFANEEAWSIKSMIRFIMLSNAYRMSSKGDNKSLAIDPNNDWFWRQNMRRLSAEELRDSILAVTGNLNREIYGPSIYPVIPQEVLQGQSQPGSGWGKSSAEQRNRRSVYIYVKRSLKVPIIEGFDFAETDLSCPVRFVTTQPTQALGLLNSKFSSDQAERLAARIRNDAENLSDQVTRALWLVTQRQPSDDEIVKGLSLIEQLQKQDQADAEFALKTFCLMALNLNEFIYLD